MDGMQFILLILSLVAMAFVYSLPRGKDKNTLPLEGGCAALSRNATVSVFIYGVMAVALCWLALLASSDVSSFAYFQF